jgi:REP element-mobilizing transposase RayT
MARPLRILFPGAWYHVMNRGLEHRKIFLNPADINKFFRLLAEASERYAVEVHAYCLMGNHYHLLMRTREANLPDAMRHIDGVYTQAFNRAHGRDGPLLRGRYRAITVQADRHLVCASRYIHINPVDAGEVHLPEQWPHSSYRAYLGADDQPPWLHTSMILDWFGPVGSRARYRAFVEEGIDQATRSFYTAARLSPILGSVPYRHEIAAVLGKDLDERMPEIPDARRLRVRPTLRAIARAVAEAFEVEEDKIRAIGHGRNSGASVARGAFIDLAVRVGRYRMRDASSWLGYSRASSGSDAAARFRAARAESEDLNTRAHTAIEALKRSPRSLNRTTKT